MLSRTWNGRTIRQRADGYLSLTDMAQACGKFFADWYRLKSTDEYLQALEESMGIPIDQLIEVNESIGANENRGTWGHRRVAIRVAQWCNVRFAIQVDIWIEELLLTGKVEIREQPKQLPTELKLQAIADTVEKLHNIIGYDFQNPRIKQTVHDLIGDIIMGQSSLPGTKETWLGVAERAEQLGYSVALVTKHRSQLGKWVKLSGLECKVEKRLCSGTQRPVNLYLQCDELDVCIKEFMDAKVLAQ